MRPGITFVDLGSVGTTPNITHKISVTVDNKTYVGEGRSKKLGRKYVASLACTELFGIVYSEEESNVVVIQ